MNEAGGLGCVRWRNQWVVKRLQRLTHSLLLHMQAGTFVLYNEATLTPPDNETQLNEMSDVPVGNAAASPANVSTTPAPICVEGASAWMGCILVNLPAVMGEPCQAAQVAR